MGIVRQMRLVSNNIGYGPCPEPDDEVEQHLILSSDGELRFFSFCYGDGEPYDKAKERCFKTISPEKARYVLSLITAYFEHNSDGIFATDVGEWSLVLIDESGTEVRYKGSLCDGYEFEGKNLSSVLREVVGMPNLFAFDDCGEEIVIERITLDYQRVRQCRNDPAFAQEFPFVTLETSERLLIDRSTDTIEISKTETDGVEIHHSYRFAYGVDVFLDRYGKDLFEDMPTTPPEAAEMPTDVRKYSLSMELSGGGRVERSGYYDKFGVPDDLQDFMEGLTGFLQAHSKMEIFDPDLYLFTNRVPEENLIFCSCSFKRHGPTYYYLTDDHTLQVGDFVLVPVGSHGREKVVRIEKIDVRPESKPLFDPAQTKRIICRCEPDEEPNAWTPPPPYFCPLIGREVTDDECFSICLVIQNDEDSETLNRFNPPPKWDADKESICWQCEHIFGNGEL